ncbi:MAG: UMP kinase [Alphaproteobacteria bacterium]|jgi:uridylate kinase|nr:UMP kinase [Alphaproteobacteria bacterium]MBP9877696.1 UMP kinase [Alphaproteobacteria bacterium]
MPTSKPLYKRVLIKISGESLLGKQQYGIDSDKIEAISKEVKKVLDMGVEVGLVVGAGNIFRGVSSAAKGIDRAHADYMGMLATVMNALALQSALEHLNIQTHVMSAIPMDQICEPYVRRKAMHHIGHGSVVIFAAGTGNPFFTTDTAAALRASEMGCDALLKATNVDGVYCSDPKKNSDAKKYQKLTYMEVLSQDLKVMDASAVSLARENDIPVVIFSIHKENAFLDVICGQGDFTIIQ